MSGLRLLVGDNCSAATPLALSLDTTGFGADGSGPVCELLVVSVMAGVYDAGRRHLFVPRGPSTKLSDQPNRVQALVCCCSNSSGDDAEYVVLLTPEHGASLLLPREGACNASEVRLCPPDFSGEAPPASNNGLVVVACGMDPYAVLMDATRILADATGVRDSDLRAYVLPLLDGVCRLRFDATLPRGKTAASGLVAGGKATRCASALEQQLHAGILVQAGPGCPAKPLLQAPGLRLCQGMSAPLGLRYSGMSVVYGSATGHVLAIMETPAALKMAPTSGMRSAVGGGSPASRPSGGAESPSAVSAGVSAATSATPSPAMSRSNSCGGDVGATDAATLPAAMPPTTPPRLPTLALSGRSITAAPIIQVMAAASSQATSTLQRPSQTTPTGTLAEVVGSFALVGVKTSSGRDGVVRCCRVMPASALGVVPADEAEPTAAFAGLGLVVQVEVTCTSAGTLLMYVESAEEEPAVALGSEDGQSEAQCVSPVERVLINGMPASWRYDSTGGILAVDLAPSPLAAGPRDVQVFL